jgi:hypothetical protein
MEGQGTKLERVDGFHPPPLLLLFQLIPYETKINHAVKILNKCNFFPE